jgi:hypothetical protein
VAIVIRKPGLDRQSGQPVETPSPAVGQRSSRRSFSALRKRRNRQAGSIAGRFAPFIDRIPELINL